MADDEDQTTPVEPKPEEPKAEGEKPQPAQVDQPIPDTRTEPEQKTETPQLPQQPEPPKAEGPKLEEVKPLDPEEPHPKDDQPASQRGEPMAEKEEKPLEPRADVDVEVKKQLNEKVVELLQKANQARKDRKQENLNRIIELAGKKEINNQDIRDLLQVSRSTAASYLSTLVKNGKLKKDKKAKATVYRS